MAFKKTGRGRRDSRNSRSKESSVNSSNTSSSQSFGQYSRYSQGDSDSRSSSRSKSRSSSSASSADSSFSASSSTVGGSRADELGNSPSDNHARSRYSRDAYGSTAQSSNRRATNAYSGRAHSKRPLIIALVIILLVAAVGAGTAFAYLNTINHKLSTGVDADLLEQLQDTQYSGEPFYALLLGIDKDEERTGSSEFGDTFRTDSMMLARVDPKQKKATLISIPRDTMVDMEENGTQKINAAYAIGGPAYAVKMVSQLAGVPISHYAEIDFDGFSGIVDSLGGIEVNVPTAIDDDQAGGSLKAGLQTLNGTQSLILCRSRHTYDDQGAGDLYRAANQRTVLGAIAKKLLNSDPVTIVSTVSTAANYTTTDLSVADLVAIANSMRGMNPATDIYSAAVPTTSQYVNEAWYEVVDKTSWAAMMQRVDQGLSPTTTTVVDSETGVILSSSGDGTTASTYGSSTTDATNSATGTNTSNTTNITNQKFTGSVAVRNGTGTSGVAASAAQKIANLGFTTETGNADSSSYTKTLVIYTNSSQAQGATAIVSALGVGSTQVNDGTYILKDDYLVVIGSDYK